MNSIKKYSKKVLTISCSLIFHAVFLLILNVFLITPSYLPETEITLDIEEEGSLSAKLRYKPEANSKIGELSNQNKNSVQKAAKKVGVNSHTDQKLVAKDATISKETIMLASLSSVVELRENLRFALTEIVVDSLGAFTPIHAAGPETDFLIDGIKNGFGSGSRTGLKVRFGGRKGRPRCPAFTPIDTSYVINTDSTAIIYE